MIEQNNNSILDQAEIQNDILRISPEVEKGNIEYKVMLGDCTEERFQHLCTQMKWRISEGHGEAMYILGVSDDGILVGLTQQEYDYALSRLKKMADALKADISVVRERKVSGVMRQLIQSDYFPLKTSSSQPEDNQELQISDQKHSEVDSFINQLDLVNKADEYTVAEILVRQQYDDSNMQELRIAFLGSTGAGKSSLLGYLSHGELDNGRGRARLNLLRHRHEIESGRSSSISHSIIGFDSSGKLLNAGSAHQFVVSPSRETDEINDQSGYGSWCEGQILNSASKVIMLLDTCGHGKYISTTIQGLTAYSPDYACLVIDGQSQTIDQTTKEVLGLALVLNVPVFVVLTHIDMIQDTAVLKTTISSLARLLMLPGTNRIPQIIQNMDDVSNCAQSILLNKIVPIFITSCVTGGNMNFLVNFLNLLPSKESTLNSDNQVITESYQKLMEDDVLFSIEETFNVPKVGLVVSGRLEQGQLISKHHLTDERLGSEDKNNLSKSQLYIGPVDEIGGKFVPINISSIHRQRRPVKLVRPLQSSSLALNGISKDQVRRGMIITATPDLQSYYELEAKVCILYAPNECIAQVNCQQEGIQSVLDEFSRKRKSSQHADDLSNDTSVPTRKSPQRLRKPRWGYLHVGTVFQQALILSAQCIDEGQDEEVIHDKNNVSIKTGQRFRIKFRFIKSSEYVKVGSRLLYREAKTDFKGRKLPGIKMVGEVTAVVDKEKSHLK